MLTLYDAIKIVEPLTHEQLSEIVRNALLRHPDVLDAARLFVDRDVAQRKLFIRGLGWETTTEKLRALFSSYGELDEAVVILDKVTGKSKGFGFTTFKHVDGAIMALKEPSKKIDGRVTVTQLAAAGNTGGGGGTGAGGGGYAIASLVDPVKNIDGHQFNCKLATEGKKGKPPGPMGVHQGNGEGIRASGGLYSGTAGDYKQSLQYGGYLGQYNRPAGALSAPRAPPGGAYQGMHPYY